MTRDYFDEAKWFCEQFHGSSMTDDDIAREYALRGFEARVAINHNVVKMEDKGEITDLRKAASRMNLKRRLNQIHHTLRLAGK